MTVLGNPHWQWRAGVGLVLFDLLAAEFAGQPGIMFSAVGIPLLGLGILMPVAYEFAGTVARLGAESNGGDSL